jgi:hypothetical protein
MIRQNLSKDKNMAVFALGSSSMIEH